MKRVELILDLLRTGAVLSCTEIQEDVDLQETNRSTRLEGLRVGHGRQHKHLKKKNTSRMIQQREIFKKKEGSKIIILSHTPQQK